MTNLVNIIFYYEIEYVAIAGLIVFIVAYIRGWIEFDFDRSGSNGEFGEADAW